VVRWGHGDSSRAPSAWESRDHVACLPFLKRITNLTKSAGRSFESKDRSQRPWVLLVTNLTYFSKFLQMFAFLQVTFGASSTALCEVEIAAVLRSNRAL
jgi:hypothetical protein